MKTIYFIRHAKSSWKFNQLSDQQRPLNKRGYQSATLIGAWFQKKGLFIDLIYSSPAIRTHSTAQIISNQIKYPLEKIKLINDFYEFSGSGENIFKELKKIPKNVNTLAVFGHNSTFENIAYLVSKGEILHFPTCGVCAVTYNSSSWNDININSLMFDFFISPKELE